MPPLQYGTCADFAALPSVMSHLFCRIKAPKFDPGVLRRKLPGDFCVSVVTMALPCRDGCGGLGQAVHAPVQALANQNVQFDFGHVEPTAVLRGVDELEAVPKMLGLGRRKRFIERTGTVRVQVVHDQRNLSGVGVLFGQVA